MEQQNNKQEEITLSFKKYEIDNLMKLLRMSGSQFYGYPFYLVSSERIEKLEKQLMFTYRSIERQLEQK
jgi:hypothetical protein